MRILFKKSFQSKLFFSTCVIASLAIFTYTYLFYQYNSQIMKENLEKTTVSSLDLFESRFKDMLSSSSGSLNTLQTSELIMTTARHIPDSAKNYFSQNPSIATDFENSFRSTLLPKDTNSGIHYISRYYDYIGVSDFFSVPYINKQQIKDTPEVSELLNTKEYLIYLAPHQNFWTNEKKLVISVVRPVRDTYRVYGILEYTLDVSNIDSLLTDINEENLYQVAILDENDNLTYSSEGSADPNEIISGYRQRDSASESGAYFVDSKNLSVYKTFSLTGWKLILNYNISSFADTMNDLIVMALFIFVIMFLIITFLLFILTRHLASPLKSLRDQLMTFEMNQNYKMKIPSNDNEIIVLTNAIQEFIQQIYIQNNKLLEANKRTLKAHYDTLEAQMNPHFLYNTLSVIGALGLAEGNRTVSKMCSELANILRYSISYSGKIVPLENEIHNITSYLYIMKMRYEEDLEYEWDLDSSLNTVKVPKLVLQPLIENCFKHGFQKAAPPWCIKVSTFSRDQTWFVSIKNNGAPFPDEKTTEIMNNVESFDKLLNGDVAFGGTDESHGLGLESTILRLRIHYNGNEHFRIFTEGPWTTVEIGGPIHEADI